MPPYAGSGMHMMKMMFGPDGFFAANVTMATLIQEAYGIEANQLAGGPDWIKTDRFDAQGKADNSQMSNPPGERLGSVIRPMLRAGLAESTKLAVHTETKNISTYTLVVADGGSKLQPAQDSNGPGGGRGMMRRMTAQKSSQGQVVGLVAQGIPISDFANQLALQLGVPVIEKTDLKSNYNFDLQWAAQATPNASENPAPEDTDSAQSISTAIEQQLGLKLVPQTQPMPVVVIDHIEKPAEN